MDTTKQHPKKEGTEPDTSSKSDTRAEDSEDKSNQTPVSTDKPVREQQDKDDDDQYHVET